MIRRINIIGSGNVGSHIAKSLSGKLEIKSIYSHNLSNAESLASEVGGIPVSDVLELSSDVDLNIIAIKDDCIESVIQELPKNIPTVHTSGTKGIEVFSDFLSYGSFYPLQTFSKDTDLDMSKIPFLIEANRKEFEIDLINLAQRNLSKNTSVVDSESRANIHLAAVITNNFTTQLLVEAQTILEKSKIDLNILQPLLEETIRKSFLNSPIKALTGPAKREDINVLEKQHKAIDNNKLKTVYKLMSELILGKDINF
jgi:predicted short-subunit dehydrogenase-like oxidoreductase (DUF2520 family)